MTYDLKTTIKKCIEKDPNLRPTMGQVAEFIEVKLIDMTIQINTIKDSSPT